MFLLQSVNVNDKVIIIADTRHTQRWSERKVDPTLCKGDLAFFCISPTTLVILRLWAHERTLGVPRNVDDLETIDFAEKLGTIAADQHLTRCVQACLAGAEVIKLNSTIRERLTKSSETKTWKTEETPWKKLIEKLICLNKHHCLVTRIPERTSSILASSSSQSSRCDQTITTKLATSTERSTRADVTCCPGSTRLYQCRQGFSMLGMRQRKAETSKTRSVTASTLHVQPRSGSRCVRDR